MEPSSLMEDDIDWEHVGVQVPPPPPVSAMEPERVMDVPRHAARRERQAPRPKYEGDHEICTECNRMTCGVCGAEIPAHRARAHREGRDGARPECPIQDVRAIALERERPRSFAEQLFGVVAS